MNQSIKPNRTLIGGILPKLLIFPKIGWKIFDILKVPNKEIGKVYWVKCPTKLSYNFTTKLSIPPWEKGMEIQNFLTFPDSLHCAPRTWATFKSPALLGLMFYSIVWFIKITNI